MRGIHTVRNYVGEARAGRRMLERSGLGVSSLERMCGVRILQTGDSKRRKDDDQKNYDEKDRMLSAVGSFIVSLLLLFMFSGSSGGGRGRGAGLKVSAA